jgi:hypothetical protein
LREMQRQFWSDDPDFVHVFRSARARTAQQGDLGGVCTGCSVALLVFSFLSLLAGQPALSSLLLVLAFLAWKVKQT